MSITSSLSNALSGLNAASRSAEVVSANVANAMTQGYARRDITLGVRQVGHTGQGVAVLGISRAVDQMLLADRRIAQANTGDRSIRQNFLARLENVLGNSDAPGSLSSRVSQFDTALIEAASRPESQARLTAVLDGANGLVTAIKTASRDIQDARSTADHRIAVDVDQLNQALANVADLNVQIRATHSASRDASALMDQRQQLVDRISTIIPVREIDRGHGQIGLFTTGGAVLLEGKPAKLGFAAVGLITPDMTLASGALSGLTLNGRPMQTEGPASTILGGSLAANFAIRDTLAPAGQQQLDAVARDLVSRFADPALDTTRAPGAAGLFTDAGNAFSPADEVGLAQRLSVNPLADPAQGGAVWRLRDGVGAAAPGPPGNSALLTALQAALTEPRIPASGGFSAGARSFSSLTAEMASLTATQRLFADGELAFSSAQSATLISLEAEGGVDTDQEMQKLLQIEQAYSANARVIQAIDDMIQVLMGL